MKESCPSKNQCIAKVWCSRVECDVEKNGQPSYKVKWSIDISVPSNKDLSTILYILVRISNKNLMKFKIQTAPNVSKQLYHTLKLKTELIGENKWNLCDGYGLCWMSYVRWKSVSLIFSWFSNNWSVKAFNAVMNWKSYGSKRFREHQAGINLNRWVCFI